MAMAAAAAAMPNWTPACPPARLAVISERTHDDDDDDDGDAGQGGHGFGRRSAREYFPMMKLTRMDSGLRRRRRRHCNARRTNERR